MNAQTKLKPPGHLSANSKRLWRSITDAYDIDPAAGPILQNYLEAMELHEQARATIAAEGQIVKDRFGQSKAHPALATLRDAGTAMRSAFRMLGMDQEARGESPRR